MIANLALFYSVCRLSGGEHKGQSRLHLRNAVSRDPSPFSPKVQLYFLETHQNQRPVKKLDFFFTCFFQLHFLVSILTFYHNHLSSKNASKCIGVALEGKLRSPKMSLKTILVDLFVVEISCISRCKRGKTTASCQLQQIRALYTASDAYP